MTTAEPYLRSQDLSGQALLGCLGQQWARTALVAGLLMLLSLPVLSATMFCDFENETQVAAWRMVNAGKGKPARANRFATSGQCSMHLDSRRCKLPAGVWPVIEAQPPVKDWREYDRLMVDVVNASDQQADFQISVGKLATASKFDLRPRGYTRCVFYIAGIPSHISKSDISGIRFFSESPRDFSLYLDNVVLLRPGENEPPLPAEFCRQLASLEMLTLAEVERSLDGLESLIGRSRADGTVLPALDGRLASVRQRLSSVRVALKAFSGSPGDLDQLDDKLSAILRDCGRISNELDLRSRYQRLGIPENGMLVGFAPSTEKVLPRDMPFDLSVSKKVEISLARNEREAFQVAVMPKSSRLHKVRVNVSDLKGSNGAVFSQEHINCDVVGFVETKKKPPYDASYVGWWPDPILDFLGPIDIAPGDLQTFWVRVRAPKDQAPGVYRGELSVSAEGVEPAVFNLSVKVRSFKMPDCTPLPTAITCTDPPNINSVRNTMCGGPENWQKMKYVYADFLADYCLDFDSLYSREAPDFDVLKYRHDRGQLTAFNFGYFSDNPAANVAAFRPIYEKAKELGILDHAYMYGFDEVPPEKFKDLEASAAALKQAFPDVPVMATSFYGDYGFDTEAKSVDIWCPLSCLYKPDLAAKARAAGKEVWWYICCGPAHPHANWFIEYSGMDIRLLMGAMTAKYRPDGFLYWALTTWNSNTPITTGPFTKWDPVSYTTWDGDGSQFCAGPGGKPIPTIRLENYRDGQEDFAYVRILEEIISRYEAKGGSLSAGERDWLAKAKAAVVVPRTLVETMARYSLDPKRLYAWRERMADLIDCSGMADADPWGPDFNVRGFLCLGATPLAP